MNPYVILILAVVCILADPVMKFLSRPKKELDNQKKRERKKRNLIIMGFLGVIGALITISVGCYFNSKLPENVLHWCTLPCLFGTGAFVIMAAVGFISASEM